MSAPTEKHTRGARFTGLRAIEKNGLRGFGFSIHFDRDNQSAAHVLPRASNAGEVSPPASPAPIPERGSGSPDSAIFTARPSSGDSRSAARGPLENAHESPTGDPIHDEASHD